MMNNDNQKQVPFTTLDNYNAWEGFRVSCPTLKLRQAGSLFIKTIRCSLGLFAIYYSSAYAKATAGRGSLFIKTIRCSLLAIRSILFTIHYQPLTPPPHQHRLIIARGDQVVVISAPGTFVDGTVFVVTYLDQSSVENRSFQHPIS